MTYREAEVRYICSMASDFLGVPSKDCEVAPDAPASKACEENYYRQKEPDPDHPMGLLKVCGNCLYWMVVEE